jgi:Ca-activated chloride channel homolog
VPNRYCGAPVRIYGRYGGNGTAQVTLRGSINGVELKQTAPLEFPKTDVANPEINRLWAWHRINSLLKDADRKGDRSPVSGEIVRLGEEFSIVTEYTSFIVLENDAEYQRWKIARRNLETTGRDREAQAKLQAQLDIIRNKALAGLGPQAATAQKEQAKPVQLASVPSQNNSTATPASPSQPRSNPRQSWDFQGTGTSPVGPLGVLAAMWFSRRKHRAS